MPPVRDAVQSSTPSVAQNQAEMVLRQARRRFIAVTRWAGDKSGAETGSPLAILVGAEVDFQQRNPGAG